MYRIRPKGINIKSNDRDVKDGFLQESINLQWRNDSFKPIPNRLLHDINVTGYSDLIFHKVGDENQINVIGIKTNVNADSLFLSFDLAGFLAGGSTEGTILEWFGKIVDGVYQSKTVTQIPMALTPGVSFTILNGLVYFMGSGLTEAEQYYYRLQYNEADVAYEVKDMYAWKTLIPFYPEQNNIPITAPNNIKQVFSQCGLILIRFALVLKSGEIVLPSPVYANFLYGLNRDGTSIEQGDLITNIHTFVSLNLEFADGPLFDDEISAINVYATTPFYETKMGVVLWNSTENYGTSYVVDVESAKGEVAKKAEENFYLIKTIEKPTTDKILLTVGDFEADLTSTETYSKVDISTIAAGEIMPVDNFTYHKVYGKITSYNGRIVIERPVTVLSEGHIRSLALENQPSDIGFKIDTEDGKINGIAKRIDKALWFHNLQVNCRGLLSYPDYRANLVGGSIDAGGEIRLFKIRKNAKHNLSCAFNIIYVSSVIFDIGENPDDTTELKTTCFYSISIVYYNYDIITPINQELTTSYYTSENRMQFSEVGEFSVWPVLNSYRIGEGRIMAIGNNSVNPSNAEIVAPLIVGTSDGIYTINLDPRGITLIASITKTANVPYISSETLQIEDSLLFVSDKGLMAIRNGDIVNLTANSFPEQGNGNFPDPDSVYNGYGTLTAEMFGGNGTLYTIDDIINYMKGAILAYDGRRDNVWCSNPNYAFSLIFNVPSKLWTMSTLVFSKKAEFFSITKTDTGEIFTRFMIIDKTNTKLYVLSGEDYTTIVDIHLLTRPIKFEYSDNYKEILRMFARCLLIRNTEEGYFSFGLWGKQDINRFKKAITIVLKKDESLVTWPNNIRQDIPVSIRKGKYKSVTALLTGKVLPDSDITGFDFDVALVDNKRLR